MNEIVIRGNALDLGGMEIKSPTIESLQPKLRAGQGISIKGNVISATGGGGGTSAEVQHIVNNLYNDNASDIEVLSGEYGEDNASYKVYFSKDVDKLHVSYRFQFTECPLVSNAEMLMFSLFNGISYNIILGEWVNNKGLISRKSLIRHINYNISTTAKELTPNRFKGFIGKDAFYIRFTGDVTSSTSVVMNVATNRLTFTKNGLSIGIVSFADSDSVKSLFDKINALPEIECSMRTALSGVCSDLFFSQYSGEIALTYQFSYKNGTAYHDAPFVNVPYKHDKSWHTVESVIDLNTCKVWTALDGWTIRDIIRSTIENQGYITLGFNGNQYRMRDLEMHIGGYGDVETTTWFENEHGTSAPQIVSPLNPKVIVFEGHGVVDAAEGVDTPYMGVTTDRLYYLFEWLQNHDYVPVTWQKIQDWKINGGKLPKRCYCITFDDYRLENFMPLKARAPFNKYNVRAGLAVITELYPPTEQITFDGTTYTRKECWEIIMRNGWYPHSHTYDHQSYTVHKASELLGVLNQSAISCDKLGIYSDMITSPNGSYYLEDYNAMKQSSFKILCESNIQEYNCRAIHDFLICRIDMAERVAIENVLKSLA